MYNVFLMLLVSLRQKDIDNSRKGERKRLPHYYINSNPCTILYYCFEQSTTVDIFKIPLEF